MAWFYRLLKRIFSWALFVPALLVVIYILIVFYLSGSLPSPDEIIAQFASLYQRYGYEIVFLGASLEALILVSFFIPGATAVALGAIFARSGHIDLTLVILTASMGAISGYFLDYILGYFGFGEMMKRLGYGSLLVKARQGLAQAHVRAFGLGFIHPNIGAFTALAAGTLKLKFWQFAIPMTLSTLIWASIWGLAIYAMGEIVLSILTRYTFILVMVVLSIWVLFTFYERKK